jgi:hypothetical protein
MICERCGATALDRVLLAAVPQRYTKGARDVTDLQA